MARNDWDDRFERRPVRTGIGFGIAVVIGLAAVSAVGGVAFTLLNIAAQPGRIVAKTVDADNVIYNYEWFRQQVADVHATDLKIAAAIDARSAFEKSAGPRADWQLNDRQQWDQLNRIVLGLTNQRASMVAEYNGRASMANRSIFLAGLPASIN